MKTSKSAKATKAFRKLNIDAPWDQTADIKTLLDDIYGEHPHTFIEFLFTVQEAHLNPTDIQNLRTIHEGSGKHTTHLETLTQLAQSLDKAAIADKFAKLLKGTNQNPFNELVDIADRISMDRFLR